MAGTLPNQSSQTITQLIDQIFNSGHLSRLEHLHLVTTILSDYKVTDEERSRLNRVFDELQTGRLKLSS